MEEIPSLSPQNLDQLRQALADGKRCFPGLQLIQVDGLDLDLSSSELTDSCFKEARFGHAQLSNANVQGCCFQEALLWGADLSNLQAQQSFWHEADLSGSRMQKADFSEAVMHR